LFVCFGCLLASLFVVALFVCLVCLFGLFVSLFVLLLFVCLFVALFVLFIFVCFVDCLFVLFVYCCVVCLFVLLFVCFVCLFCCLFVCLFVSWFVCLLVGLVWFGVVCLLVGLFVLLFVCFVCLFVFFVCRNVVSFLFDGVQSYEIRQSIEDVVRRVRPQVAPNGEIRFTGWARMAVPIIHFKFVFISSLFLLKMLTFFIKTRCSRLRCQINKCCET